MVSKNIKTLVGFLLVLILSSTLEFPLRLKMSVAQITEEVERRALRLFLSSLSFQEGNLESLKKEGIFYCRKPVQIEGKNEYYIWISNPNRKKISIMFLQSGYQQMIPTTIDYWEPQLPEQNVEVRGPILSTNDEIVFRLFHTNKPVHLTIQQIGGDHIDIYTYEDCLEFGTTFYYSLARTTLETLDKIGYTQANEQLTRDSLRMVFHLLPSISFQGMETIRVTTIGDSGFDRTPRLSDVMEILKTIKGYVFILGDYLEKHTNFQPQNYLTFGELKEAHEFMKMARSSQNIYTLCGNHELQFLLAVLTGGKGYMPSDGAWLSEALATTDEAIQLADWIRRQPVMIRYGNTLFAHSMTPELLRLAIEYDLFDKPLDEWIKVAMKHYRKSNEIAAIYELIPRMIGNPYPEQRHLDPQTALQMYGDKLKEKGIYQVVVAHSQQYSLLDGKSINGITFRSSFRQIKKDIDVRFIKHISEQGEASMAALSQAINDNQQSSRILNKRIEALDNLKAKLKQVLTPLKSDEFVNKEIRRQLISQIDEAIDLTHDPSFEEHVGKENAKNIRIRLQKLRYQLWLAEDPGQANLGEYNKLREELKETLDVLGTETDQEVNRVLINAVQAAAEVEFHKRESFFNNLLKVLTTQEDCLKNDECFQSRIKSSLDDALRDKVIDQSEYNKLMKKLEEVRKLTGEGYIKEKFNLEAEIYAEKERARMGKGKEGWEKINYMLHHYIQPTIDVINSKLKVLENQKGFISMLKRGGLKFAKSVLVLSRKLEEYESELKLSSISKKGMALGLAIAALEFLSPVILATLRDNLGVYHPIYVAALYVSGAMKVVTFTSFVIKVASMIIAIALGTLPPKAFLAFFIALGKGFVIGFLASAILVLVFCHFNPSSSACLCNFSTAKYALTREKESPKYSSPPIEVPINWDEAYTFYAAYVTGRNCDKVKYKVRIIASKPFSHEMGVSQGATTTLLAESQNDCVMVCDAEGKCACWATIRISSQKEKYEFADIYITPSGNFLEILMDPRKWSSVYVGKVVFSSRPTPQPSPDRPTPQPSPDRPTPQPSPDRPTPQPSPDSKVTTVLTCNDVNRICTLSYSNTLEESLVVRFYLISPAERKVLDIDEKTIPAKASGQIQTKQFGCPLGRNTYTIMFQIFKSSDTKFINPLISSLMIGEVKC